MLDIIESFVIMELTDVPVSFEKNRGIQIAPKGGYSDLAKLMPKLLISGD